jgi:transglutaminase-like putative cysteine protease
MTPPPFLLGCTLLFWGWQSHLLLIATPMALILEIARWINWRWALAEKDFNRVTDFTSLFFILVMIYLINQESVHGLITLLNWLPILFFLLIGTQTYSIQGSIKLSSLFLSLRRKQSNRDSRHKIANLRINLSYPYIVICLLAASVFRTSWFAVGMFFFVGWGLWTIRPQRYPVAVWGIFLIVAGILAYVIQGGLSSLQAELEKIVINHFQNRLFANRDPYRQHTAIGDISQLKLFNKILLRVDTPYPILLRQASYNAYINTAWFAKPHHFTEIFANPRVKTTWTLTNEPGQIDNKLKLSTSPKIQISAYLQQGKGVLALPHGTYKISKLVVPTVQRHDLGAVKVENGPGLVKYTAHFSPNTPLDIPPRAEDLQLPAKQKKYLIELSNNLNLPRQQPQQVLNSLKNFFENHFQYSLNRKTPIHRNSLEYFLRHSRQGHCEYFATATVLLLRTAGIPARYAVGYAVNEYSQLEDVYIVRQRHAHAWTLAYINGDWVEFDTTPATWVELEEDMMTGWQTISDLWAWLVYQFSEWRWRDSQSNNDWILWLILPLSLILIWRLYTRKKMARSHTKLALPRNRHKLAGANSPFYQIVQQLNAAGYIRQPGETLTTWLKRIKASQMANIDIQALMTLHQRYRFDPKGLNPQEQTQLTTNVKAWLKKIQR